MVRWHLGAGQRLLGTLVPTPTQDLGPVTPRLGDSKGTIWGQVGVLWPGPSSQAWCCPGAFAVQHAGPPAFAASPCSPGPGPGHLTWERRGAEEPTP